jgi:phage-related protein (TIGR01555 family)
MVIGTGEQDLTQPLHVERVGKGGLKYLAVMSRRQLTAGEIDRDPASEWLASRSSIRSSPQRACRSIFTRRRLVIFNGNPPPDGEIVTTPYGGWGDSVPLSVVDAIKQADGTAANIASLVFEAKVNVIRIPDFMQSLGDERYRAKILERYTLAATAKGINGDLLLDKEEEYEQKQASFATLPEVLMSFLQIVSGAADIPATRLLGQSPAGMNATGESDLRNYYDRLQARPCRRSR